VAVTFDNQGANVAVSLGTMPVTMVVDTGAIGMTVTETVANWLVAKYHATNAPSEKHVLAGGVEKEFKSVDIDTLNIAGHEIHKVRAGVVPDGTSMLLGLACSPWSAAQAHAFTARAAWDLGHDVSDPRHLARDQRSRRSLDPGICRSARLSHVEILHL
jgi:gag-polyprotein putative aspartyl protease